MKPITENIITESNLGITDKVENAILTILSLYEQEAFEREFPNDKEWTSFLKVRLGNLGNKLGCSVCTSGFNDVFAGEWMYDMVWYKEEGENKNKRLTEVELVAEFEWQMGFNHIKFDFEKLLVANALHRLFICYVKPHKHQTTIDYFNDAVKKYKHGKAEERFLVVMLDYDTNQFIYHLIVRE